MESKIPDYYQRMIRRVNEHTIGCFTSVTSITFFTYSIIVFVASFVLLIGLSAPVKQSSESLDTLIDTSSFVGDATAMFRFTGFTLWLTFVGVALIDPFLRETGKLWWREHAPSFTEFPIITVDLAENLVILLPPGIMTITTFVYLCIGISQYVQTNRVSEVAGNWFEVLLVVMSIIFFLNLALAIFYSVRVYRNVKNLQRDLMSSSYTPSRALLKSI